MLTPLLVCCLCLVGPALAADILAVFPHSAKSHFDVFEPLILKLVSRRHHVTVVSFYPQKTAPPNYTDVSLVGAAPVFVNSLKMEYVVGMSAIADYMTITNMGVQSCEELLRHPPVQELLLSSRTFDLLIVEMFNTDCFLGFADKFSAPLIGVSSAGIFPPTYTRLGNFDNPAYFPNLFLPLTPRMNFAQRVTNFVTTVSMRLLRHYHFSVTEHRAVRSVFGREVPLQRVAHNVSLMLVNTHHSLQGALPLVPGYVDVGGIHISDEKPLSQELDQYLNESPEGAILFSMGSVLQSSSFPPDKRQAIMEAFAELPVRVIMKWENDSVSLPGQPANVKLSKWLPQRDILAHPKIVAFMGHGGLLSTSEAVYCGVPMVLIPMFGDQPNNVAHLSALGAAVKLAYEDISKEAVLKALRAVLYDASYRENAKIVSERFRDRPMAPLDTAVYWTEYVLRHKGARHLRSPAVDMPWYQLWLLDVAGVLLTGTAVTLYLLYWLVKKATTLILQRRAKMHPE